MNTARVGKAGTVAVVTGLALVLGLFVWTAVRPGGDDGGTPAGAPATRPGTSAGVFDFPRGSARGTHAGTAGHAVAGLPGHGYSSAVPAMRLVMTVRSAGPIGRLGYLVPTSQDHASGVVEHVGTTWRLTTRVHGRPDYARLWIQAGPAGTPVTCTISVDGRVTDQRSTDGPYGASMCQG